MKLSDSDFKNRLKHIWGDSIDLSKTVYVNARTKVVLTCPIHGDFEKLPYNAYRGQGCKKCSQIKLSNKKAFKPIKEQRKLVAGVGLFDSELSSTDEEIKKHVLCWRSMLTRCYSETYHKKEPSYIGCTVCEEWKRFSVFKEWFDNNYIDGYALDKDIIVKGNKVYSPDTCCFVPTEINSLLISSKRKRGLCPIGVYKSKNRFRSYLSVGNNRKFLGSFKTLEEAFAVYKKFKESYIKDVAQKYYDEGKITKHVYDALMKYEVEITD